MTLQDISINDEKVKREIIDKCRDYEDEDRQIHCQIQELKRMQIKDVILSHVNLSHIDRGAGRTSHERIVKEIEKNRQLEKERQNCHTHNCNRDSTINSIVIKAAKIAPAHLPIDENRIWFNLTQMSRHDFENASVLFYVGRVKYKFPNRQYKVNFYRYISPTEIAEQSTPLSREHDSQNFQSTDDGNWDHVDITSMIREWQSDENSNYGIMIKLTVRDAAGKEIYHENVAKSEKHAFLELNSAKVRAHTKRSLSSTVEPETCRPETLNANTNCCLYPLEISFDEFGWDWVVAPKKIKFYYCAGKCDKNTLKKVDHARLLSLDSLGDMCCSPEKIDSLEIMYQDAQGNLQMRQIPNMIVRSCACS
uniref:TGF-beta family profile domain-containing protein n=1 Tax=Acrobeloides nanus TaxID=290746 RepID=A0A914DFY2_9BILA